MAAQHDRRWLVVGRVSRTHGVRGEVSVDLRTDEPAARFAPGAVLATDPAAAGPLTVTATRPHQGRLLVTFAGVTDCDAATGLRGVRLLAEVSAGDRAGAGGADDGDADEFHDFQLEGLAVRTVEGAEIGEVARVLHHPGQELLAVRLAAGGEALVPFVSAIVPRVDLAAGVLVVDPPGGLLELAEVPD